MEWKAHVPIVRWGLTHNTAPAQPFVRPPVRAHRITPTSRQAVQELYHAAVALNRPDAEGLLALSEALAPSAP